MDIEGIRPKLISEESFQYPNELGGFRYVFRHAYGIELDVDRVILLAEKSLKLKDIFQRDLENFRRKLMEGY